MWRESYRAWEITMYTEVVSSTKWTHEIWGGGDEAVNTVRNIEEIGQTQYKKFGNGRH